VNYQDIFPLKIAVWDIRYLLLHLARSPTELFQKVPDNSNSSVNPIGLVRRALPPNLPIEIKEVIPRLKDGGAYVKFSHKPGTTEEEIESALQSYQDEHAVNPWFNPLRSVRSFRVRGRPWMEDLYRFPSQSIRVEFMPAADGTQPVELSQESLYALFRQYGKIGEIISQPSDSKVVPRYAEIYFIKLRSATVAKSCLHGFKAFEADGGGKAGTQLSISYQKRMKAHAIRDWIVNHPRIVIPLIAALIAGLSVIIFDP
jgi:hypothetical protein